MCVCMRAHARGCFGRVAQIHILNAQRGHYRPFVDLAYIGAHPPSALASVLLGSELALPFTSRSRPRKRTRRRARTHARTHVCTHARARTRASATGWRLCWLPALSVTAAAPLQHFFVGEAFHRGSLRSGISNSEVGLETLCACARARVCVGVRARVRACARACVRVCMRACLHVCVHACMLARARACLHVRVHACTCACMRASFHVCECECECGVRRA